MSKHQQTTTAADVLGPYLADQCVTVLTISAELQRAFDADRARELPAERIHQARVGCRRLRSTLRVFDDFFLAEQAESLSDELRWFGLRLGAVRDLDVLGERLTAAVDRMEDDLVLHQAAQELADQLLFRRRIALAALRDALHDERYAELLQQLEKWKDQPAWTARADKPATKIKKYVKRAGYRLDRRLRHAADAINADDPETDALIHSARKAAKRHRYAVEASASVFGSAADRTIARRKRLQDQLGDYQDSRLASILLRDLGGIPGRNGFTFGILYDQELQHRRHLRKKIAKRAPTS
ncbi:CHAD domain-containing protein [Microlunatus elymi]|uniref:CHAD domain-containing protein n=1 Tax=Microlunatus elymi TaxID=2596828 RepID=UPI00143DE109|nr:CHAD domain-containing protein [Microlunatus elymi]